jgi:hypothetical protein
MPLVSQALTHAGKSVQRVGFQVLKEMSEDPHLTGRILPNRLHILIERLRESGTCSLDDLNETCPQAKARSDSEEGEKTPSSESKTPASESEEGKKPLVRNRKTLSSDSESGLKPAAEGLLRNQEAKSTVRTVLSTNSIKVRTVPRARELDLKLPERFLALKEEQQAGVLVALQQVSGDQRQAMLDEWAARCCDSKVRNPAGYLYGIVQKALRGDFKAWVAQEANTGRDSSETAGKAAEKASALASPSPSSSPPVSREATQAHLTRLASILKKPGPGRE